MVPVLDRKVLVLNKHFTAIGVMPLKRAIKILFAEPDDPIKAEIIDHSSDGTLRLTWGEWAELSPKKDEAALRTFSKHYRVPEIIKLSSYDKLPASRTRYCRRTIFRRDASTCQYCRKKFASHLLNLDHIHPRASGGESTWTNVVLSCVYCNKCKADRVPVVKHAFHEGKMTTIYTVSFRDGPKNWTVTLPQPEKPKSDFFHGETIHYESWKPWLGLAS